MVKKAILCSLPWKDDCPYMKFKNWKRPVCTYPNVKTKTELVETATGKLVEEEIAICPLFEEVNPGEDNKMQ